MLKYAETTGLICKILVPELGVRHEKPLGVSRVVPLSDDTHRRMMNFQDVCAALCNAF
jgi:hypothetical protein